MRQTLKLVTAAGISLGLAASALAQSLNRPPQDEVFYQIMPIAWRDSDNDTRSGQPARFGDFQGLTDSLEYLEYLGITAVYLQPIFPSPAYHGYQHGDASTLNPWFGTEPQFLNFVNQAHARGIKVILDYVAYGVSQSSVYYTSAYNTPTSTYDPYLAFTNTRNTTFVGSNYSTWNGSSVGFINWNLNNTGAVGLVTNWARKWLDPNNDGDTSDGVDGFRLDHAYSNSPEGWGATNTFWQNWCTSLRARKSNIFIFAEPGDWGNYGTDMLTPTGFDAIITKPFQFASRDAVNQNNAQKLYDSVRATVAAVPAGKLVVAQTNDHDSDRLANVLGTDAGKHRACAAVLFTQPFPPNIWYGDELAMRGTKGNFGSDANDIPMREPFKWNAVAGPPMSNYSVLNAAAYNARVSRDNDGRSVQEQRGVAGSMLETYRSLIAIRKNSVALRRGSYAAVPSGSSRVYACVRQTPDQSVVVAINLSGATVSAALDLSAFPVNASGATTNLGGTAAPTPITPQNRAAWPVTLPPYSWIIADAPLAIPAAAAVPPVSIDGVNIPADLGPAALRASQTTTPSMGDNVGELDQLFVRASPQGLKVGVTGNIPTDGAALALLIDPQLTGPLAGQNVLNTANVPAPPGGVAAMSGTVMDVGFSPRHMLFINCFSGAVYVDHVHLLPDGALKFYRGAGQTNSGSGLLTGGTNPTGLAVAVNRTNAAGITGTSVAGAATATAGFELLIPYGDVGLPPSALQRAGRSVGVSAMLVKTDGTLSNQTLPGVPATITTDLGTDPNFATIAGSQWVNVPMPSAGDFDADGSRTIDDLFLYLNAWFASSPGSDTNGDGARTIDDLFVFLAAWFQG